MTTLKNHIDMKPVQHRLDEHRRRLEAAAKDASPKQEPLTRARLIAAIERINLICEDQGCTNVAKLVSINILARQLVDEWNNE